MVLENEKLAWIEPLTERFYPQLKRIVCQLSPRACPLCVEDVLQEVKCRALANGSKVPFVDVNAGNWNDERIVVRVVGWLRRAVKTVCLEHFRKTRRIRTSVVIDDCPATEPSLPNEGIAMMTEALAKCDAATRNILHARIQDERSHASIAIEMGLTESGSRTRVRRALQKLRKNFMEVQRDWSRQEK